MRKIKKLKKPLTVEQKIARRNLISFGTFLPWGARLLADGNGC
ncbi:hypothetical protein ACQ86N_22240 [Puia sp. P3]